MKPYTLHAEAEAELGRAFEYYERQQTGLAGDFRREFEAALQRVRDNPLSYPTEESTGARYCPLRRFPYTLVYVELDDRVWVSAVAHQRRRPRYWLDRQPG